MSGISSNHRCSYHWCAAGGSYHSIGLTRVPYQPLIQYYIVQLQLIIVSLNKFSNPIPSYFHPSFFYIILNPTLIQVQPIPHYPQHTTPRS